VKVRNIEGGGNISLYVDTRRRLKGPELLLSGPIDLTEGAWLAVRVDKGWLGTTGEALCDTDLTFLRREDIAVITFGMGCLRNPSTRDLVTGDVVRRTHWKAPEEVAITALADDGDGSLDCHPGCVGSTRWSRGADPDLGGPVATR